ncbi:hypothetical protein ACJRO7_027084 [Eucalyptus globulus]|uniref:Uncharacterized protein n=1 Tax=Eucalyptus globulus TaxID=34317 RepID=A0ABD3JPY4_EUCGL
MSRKQFIRTLLLLISLTTAHVIYKIIDHSARAPGGNKYADELSSDYKASVLFGATEQVLNTFSQKEGEGNFAQSPHAIASTKDNIIWLNADYLQHYQGDLKEEFTGVAYHEITHVWQWTATVWPLLMALPITMGSGSRWDDGYAVTAYFLDYCNDLEHGFVAELNALVKYSYSETFLIPVLVKYLHDLWRDCKLAYGTTGIPGSEEGHRKPITCTRPFDNSIPWKTDDVLKNNADLNSLENNNYFRIEFDGVVFDAKDFQQNDNAERAQALGCLAELSAMLEKNGAPIPSINSRRLDPKWQRAKGRTSRSETDVPVTNL